MVQYDMAEGSGGCFLVVQVLVVISFSPDSPSHQLGPYSAFSLGVLSEPFGHTEWDLYALIQVYKYSIKLSLLDLAVTGVF